MNDTVYDHLREIGAEYGVEIHRPGATQLHFLVQSPANLINLCSRLRDEGFYPLTVIANDERELEDDCFKIYYLFSHPLENIFLAVEYGLQPNRETYPSIYPIYPSVEPFEREIADLFGLLPEQKEPRVMNQSYLHSCYPAGLYPLRRDWSVEAFTRLMVGSETVLTLPPQLEGLRRPPQGELFLPVGPIHNGTLEAGNFTFRVSGEAIEGLNLLLGYTHKGVERLFQRCFDLRSGWRLAERIGGDASFAHNLAYSKAVEVMGSAAPPSEAHLLRALLLELERIANHINDCAALAHDLALLVPAAEISVLREQAMRLNGRLTGSRFLRGVNFPGGAALPRPLDTWDVRSTVREIAERFTEMAQKLVERSDFRERTIGVGVLPRETARQLGVTGLAARASGIQRDFRIQHPFGPYGHTEAKAILRGDAPHTWPLTTNLEMSGDVFCRFVQRVVEVSASQRLVDYFLDLWPRGQQTNFSVPIAPGIVPNYEWGLGYAEGWRGDVVYWLMKDKFDRIYRCKVRDPSTLNWPGLRAAVAPEWDGAETALADFPLINKSFNLSYSGNDL